MYPKFQDFGDVMVRGNGYGVAAEGGMYYVTYKSTRYQVAHDEFEQTQWQNRVNGIAVATMMVSLFAFIDIESTRFGSGRHRVTHLQLERRRGSPAP